MSCRPFSARLEIRLGDDLIVAEGAHDLRRTFITVAESSDISPIALKALVNHSLGKDVTSGYVVMTVDRLREPAQKVCDRMAELCQVPKLEGAKRLV